MDPSVRLTGMFCVLAAAYRLLHVFVCVARARACDCVHVLMSYMVERRPQLERGVKWRVFANHYFIAVWLRFEMWAIASALRTEWNGRARGINECSFWHESILMLEDFLDLLFFFFWHSIEFSVAKFDSYFFLCYLNHGGDKYVQKTY